MENFCKNTCVKICITTKLVLSLQYQITTHTNNKAMKHKLMEISSLIGKIQTYMDRISREQGCSIVDENSPSDLLYNTFLAYKDEHNNLIDSIIEQEAKKPFISVEEYEKFDVLRANLQSMCIVQYKNSPTQHHSKPDFSTTRTRLICAEYFDNLRAIRDKYDEGLKEKLEVLLFRLEIELVENMSKYIKEVKTW